MTLVRTKLHFLQRSGSLASIACTGVSLHCHTEHSKENLDFLPFYADSIPIIAHLWRREAARYEAREHRRVDFETAYWTPPLDPLTVYDSEVKQLNDAGLNAIVSITDHDSIDANLTVNSTIKSANAPVSLEWTVPFDRGFFHLGVHNLPRHRADEITSTLLGYTHDPAKHSTQNLNSMFSMLEGFPEVLVVLNHPLWDIEMVGQELHETLLAEFLSLHGSWIHALEVNGFRSWSENKATIEIAESLGIPVVAGGDRHGAMPNTVINVSSTACFEEFAGDLRISRRNEVAFMPEYGRPLLSRQLQSFSEILGYHPALSANRQRWIDRVYFDTGDGTGLRSIAELGVVTGPLWLRGAIKSLGILGNPRLALLFKVARRRKDRVPSHVDQAGFELNDVEELTTSLTTEPVS